MRYVALLALLATAAHAVPRTGEWLAESDGTWHTRTCPAELPIDRAVALPKGCVAPMPTYAHSVSLTKALVKERSISNILVPQLRAELLTSRASCDTQTESLRTSLGHAINSMEVMQAALAGVGEAHRADLVAQRRRHTEERWEIIRAGVSVCLVVALGVGIAGYAAGVD